jgi:hypothetical protein
MVHKNLCVSESSTFAQSLNYVDYNNNDDNDIDRWSVCAPSALPRDLSFRRYWFEL